VMLPARRQDAASIFSLFTSALHQIEISLQWWLTRSSKAVRRTRVDAHFPKPDRTGFRRIGI
jgi:hypothetical protein